MQPRRFEGRQPQLRLEEYFFGRTTAWGLFEDRFGTLRRQFRVDIDGAWDGQVLSLKEDFTYDDGERETRTWHIRRTGEHGYVGTAEGILGEARGEVFGNALRWRYRFNLPIGGRPVAVDFDDWMFLQDARCLMNRARVRKFGLLLGEATIVYVREEAAQALAEAAQ